MSVPSIRIRPLNSADPRAHGDFVLYWMVAQRRTSFNFALDRAVEWASELDQPLLILEALRCDYPWASQRLHAFVIEGVADNARACERGHATHYAYVEPEPGAGQGLVDRLAEDAAVVVTDDWPTFFVGPMVDAVGQRLPVRAEAVDSNGLWPMRATDRVFARAFDFRRFLQKELRPHLQDVPRRTPLRTELRPLDAVPKEVRERWPRASAELLDGDDEALGALPIDHDVARAPFAGGAKSGGRVLKAFLSERLDRYGEDRNHPDDDASSGLSPWLHFGHVSAHEIFEAVTAREDWSPDALGEKANGKRTGWWGLSEAAESFLDELVTWRELGFNMCALRDDYDRFETLPEWARETLDEHADDDRPYEYSLEEFERAATHDELWNAAQRQLRGEGRLHNYLRMLWGKKILHWSESPQDALATMIELNNKYAVDGRDPNSYSGIFWVLGRYDRAWGPERAVFGKVRTMTSASTRRKLRLDHYLDRWAATPSLWSE